tara:strand:+ start:603 stop:800 length:198 start_codon:yes stop_codon:yes gene_type:complete
MGNTTQYSNLSKDEIEEVVYRLDNLLGNNFSDIIYGVLFNREDYVEQEISESDIHAVKTHLKTVL